MVEAQFGQEEVWLGQCRWDSGAQFLKAGVPDGILSSPSLGNSRVSKEAART